MLEAFSIKSILPLQAVGEDLLDYLAPEINAKKVTAGW
jgi:hypothetical protein